MDCIIAGYLQLGAKEDLDWQKLEVGTVPLSPASHWYVDWMMEQDGKEMQAQLARNNLATILACYLSGTEVAVHNQCMCGVLPYSSGQVCAF